MQESNVRAFFNDDENASKKVCMKMIDRSISYLQFAMSAVAFVKADRARCVLDTVVALHKKEATMTRADAEYSCTSKSDKRHAVKHANTACIKNCDNMIDAVKRQASMSLLALENLNIIERVSKDTFKMSDSKIAQAILARYS